jgi:hypothetical protein
MRSATGASSPDGLGIAASSRKSGRTSWDQVPSIGAILGRDGREPGWLLAGGCFRDSRARLRTVECGAHEIAEER